MRSNCSSSQSGMQGTLGARVEGVKPFCRVEIAHKHVMSLNMQLRLTAQPEANRIFLIEYGDTRFGGASLTWQSLPDLHLFKKLGGRCLYILPLGKRVRAWHRSFFMWHGGAVLWLAILHGSVDTAFHIDLVAGK